MWLAYAFASAGLAGVTAVLAKCGIRKTDSTVATAIRTCVVLAFSWGLVFLSGAQRQLPALGGRTLLFLVLSGLATGASWLCYFRALQLGDISKVTAVDKSSTALTVVLAAVFLHEGLSAPRALGTCCLAAGALLMAKRQAEKTPHGAQNGNWVLFAAGSALFASLTAILGKVGIAGVDSNLGTAVRTCVVLVMAWAMVFVTGRQAMLRSVPRGEFGFICLSGLATGGSWLCYYKALQAGPASVVVPIDKLSILVTVAFSFFVFHEKLSRREAAGLALVVAGTLAMLAP